MEAITALRTLDYTTEKTVNQILDDVLRNIDLRGDQTESLRKILLLQLAWIDVAVANRAAGGL